jgi:hypothetical protein
MGGFENDFDWDAAALAAEKIRRGDYPRFTNAWEYPGLTAEIEGIRQTDPGLADTMESFRVAMLERDDRERELVTARFVAFCNGDEAALAALPELPPSTPVEYSPLRVCTDWDFDV